MAYVFVNFILYRKLFGPVGQQLVTKFRDAPILFGNVDYGLGIIVGNRTIDPISSYLIGKPNDGKVSIESTKLEGMRDHIVIPAAHAFLPQNRMVREQALHFLDKGYFTASVAKPTLVGEREPVVWDIMGRGNIPDRVELTLGHALGIEQLTLPKPLHPIP